jgi:hypothetical protein
MLWGRSVFARYASNSPSVISGGRSPSSRFFSLMGMRYFAPQADRGRRALTLYVPRANSPATFFAAPGFHPQLWNPFAVSPGGERNLTPQKRRRRLDKGRLVFLGSMQWFASGQTRSVLARRRALHDHRTQVSGKSMPRLLIKFVAWRGLLFVLQLDYIRTRFG